MIPIAHIDNTTDLSGLAQEVLKKWWVKLFLWAKPPFLVHRFTMPMFSTCEYNSNPE